MTDCGIAVVAMVARVSYEQARAAVFPARSRKALDTTVAELKRGLNAFGVEYAPRAQRFVTWEKIAGPAIVLVQLEPGRELFHWVLFVRHGARAYALDPAAPADTLRRTDFDELVGVQYLRLGPTWLQTFVGRGSRRRMNRM